MLVYVDDSVLLSVTGEVEISVCEVEDSTDVELVGFDVDGNGVLVEVESSVADSLVVKS